MRPLARERTGRRADRTLHDAAVRPVRVAILIGALTTYSPVASAQSDLGGGMREATGTSSAAPSLALAYDPFDTGTDLGTPLWLQLPQVPFMVDQGKAEGSLASAFDPRPLGPPQTLEAPPAAQVRQARSLLDPSPMGPLARVEAERPDIALETPETTAGIQTAIPHPEETGSVVILRRRY